MFSIVQQLRDYIVALQDVLPYVTGTLTAVTYVEPAPKASKNIIFPISIKSLLVSCNPIVKCKEKTCNYIVSFISRNPIPHT